MFYFPSVSNNFGFNGAQIKTLESGSELEICLPVNCIGVCLKCRQIILLACSNHVCSPQEPADTYLARAEHKIQSSVQIQSCVQNSLSSTHPTLYHVHFLPRRILLRRYIVFHLSPVHKLSAAWRTLDVWTTKPIAFNVRPDKIHRRSN